MAEDVKRCSKELEGPDLEKGLMTSHLYSAYHGGYPSSKLSYRWKSGREKRTLEIGGSGYFLDSCFLCRKKLENHRDIFMYRGDVAFCSEECRQQQIERDEGEERRSCFAAKAVAARSVEENAEGAAHRIHVLAA